MNEGVWDFTLSTSRTINDVINYVIADTFPKGFYSNSEPRLWSFYAPDLILQAPLCQFVLQCA
jgi:hypothetical protein